MIELNLPYIAGARIDIESGERILTVFTPLATTIGSADWNSFCELRSSLFRLVSRDAGFDQVRIMSLDGGEINPLAIRVYTLGDPEV